MSCKHNRRGSKQVPHCVEHIVHTIYINHIGIYRHLPFCHAPAGALRKKELRQILFEQAVDTIFTVDQVENKTSSRSRALLQASSCLGNHQASLFLATIHLSGLRQEVDQEQVHSACMHAAFIQILVCTVCFRVMPTVWLVQRVATALPSCMQGTSTHKELMAFQKISTWLTATIPMLGYKALLTVPGYMKRWYVTNIPTCVIIIKRWCLGHTLVPSSDLTLTLTITHKQPFELARTTQDILSLQKCPHFEMKKKCYKT